MSGEQRVNDSIASLLKENISEPSKQWLLDIRQSVDIECMCVLQGKSLRKKKSSKPNLSAHFNYTDIKAHIMKFQADSSSLMEKIRAALISIESDETDDEVFNLLFKILHEMNNIIEISKQHVQLTQSQQLILEKVDSIEESVLKLNLIMNSNKDKYTKKQKILIELVRLETTLGTLHGNIMQILVQTFLNGGFEFLRKLSTFTKNQHLLEKKNATYIKKAKTFFSDLISICLLSDDVTEIIIQEKTVENLLELCHACSVDVDKHGVIYKNYSGPLKSVLAELLRSLSTICSLVSGVDSFIKSNGYEIMTKLLMDPCSNHRTKIEIAGVIAQASTPTLFICQQMESYIECIPHIIKALIDLLKKSTDHNEFLLCLYALDVVSSPSPSSSPTFSFCFQSSSLSSPSSSSTPNTENDDNIFIDFMSDANVVELLINRCLEYNLDKTIFAKDKVLNILTSIYPRIIDLHIEQEKNMSQLLVNYLNDDPRPDATEIEMKTFENVVEKTANLIYEMCCRKYKMGKHFIQLNCVNALLEASKKLTRGRHDESPLNACMNALKKLYEKQDTREEASSMNQQSNMNDNSNDNASENNLI